MNEILLYTAITALWSAAHLFATRGVVAGFGALTADHKRIITMEWIVARYAIVSEADLAEGVSKLALIHGHPASKSPAAVIPNRTTGTDRAQFSQLRDTDDGRSKPSPL